MSSAEGQEVSGREEEMEGALQCTDAIPPIPPIACESRRMRCTCLILYSHMKELRSNPIETPVKGQRESISTINRQLVRPLQIVEDHLISFVKVCFSIIANCSSTVPSSPKMLLCKQSCFNIKKHLAI